MQGMPLRGSAAVALLAAGALLVSACGSSNSTGSTSSTTASGTSSAASSSSGDGTSALTWAQNLIKQYSAQPTFQAPGPSLDANKLAGKTIAVVAIDLRVPAVADVAKFVQQVDSQIGLKTTVFDAQSSPSLMQQGMQQAINNGANAIISDGLVPQLVSMQIKAAKDKGIPTVDVINTPPKAGVPGQGSDPNMFGNMAPDYTITGGLMAATAIVDTNGHADVAIMNTSELTAAASETAGMKTGLAKCSTCTVVTETDTPLSQWSTALQGLAATTIRSHPNVNFIFTLYDAMGLFATSGVQQAGGSGRVHIVSFNGTPAALALVKQGNVFVADPAQDNEWAAWGAVDQALRGMLKMQPANPVLPIRYVNTQDLKNVDVSSSASVNQALFGNSFKAGYLKLWGMS